MDIRVKIIGIVALVAFAAVGFVFAAVWPFITLRVKTGLFSLVAERQVEKLLTILPY